MQDPRLPAAADAAHSAAGGRQPLHLSSPYERRCAHRLAIAVLDALDSADPAVHARAVYRACGGRDWHREPRALQVVCQEIASAVVAAAGVYVVRPATPGRPQRPRQDR